MAYALDNPLPYNERPENWERHGGIKVSVINDDCIKVGDEIIHEGDEVYVVGNRDWGPVVAVIGTVTGWSLYDAWDLHASLDVQSRYDSDKRYGMAFCLMKEIRKIGGKN